MPLITDDYRAQNAELHVTNKKYGVSGAQWTDYVTELIGEEGFVSVLDYGAGKGTLATALALRGITVREYDPAIPGKDAAPEPAELVICTDVLEHVQPECLDDVLADLARVTQKKLLFDIALVASIKTLPDGSNPHKLIEKPDWWKERIARYFDIPTFVQRPEFAFCYGEAVPKGQGGAELARKAALPKRRRKVTPDLADFFSAIRKAQAANSDAWSRIGSIRLYEGVGDVISDMHVIFDWIDEEADPEKVIRDALSLTRKGLVVRAAITAERTAEWWRAIFDKYTRMLDWQAEAGIIAAICAPMVGISGFQVVGVLNTDDRWDNVKASTDTIDKRVRLSGPHARRAIVACYGPSLRDYVTRLSDEMAECNGQADIISVSGAHDFLLSHGIVPTYHIECDPRAHKADNIKAAHPDVQYLLGSCVNPVVFDKLCGADIALWHVGTPEHSHRFAKELGENPKLIIPGGGSVGLRSIPLLYCMGYRDFSIYGMDCSFADDGQMQWAGQHAGKRQEVMTVNVGGRLFASSPQLISYATDFIESIQKVSDCEFRVYGDGLLARMCAFYSERDRLQATAADAA